MAMAPVSQDVEYFRSIDRYVTMDPPLVPDDGIINYRTALVSARDRARDLGLVSIGGQPYSALPMTLMQYPLVCEEAVGDSAKHGFFGFQEDDWTVLDTQIRVPNQVAGAYGTIRLGLLGEVMTFYDYLRTEIKGRIVRWGDPYPMGTLYGRGWSVLDMGLEMWGEGFFECTSNGRSQIFLVARAYGSEGIVNLDFTDSLDDITEDSHIPLVFTRVSQVRRGARNGGHVRGRRLVDRIRSGHPRYGGS